MEQLISTLILSLMTAVVCVASLAFAFYMVTGRWQALARRHGAGQAAAQPGEFRDWALLDGPHRSKCLAVPAAFAVADDAVLIRTYAPLAWAMPALRLPLAQVQLVPTDWQGDHEAWALRIAGEPVVEIILRGELRDWLLPQLRSRLAAS
jgi:hypothetical protein